VTRSQADSWSNTRSLAFLAAILAITLASFLPFAVLAATPAGQPLILCSSEGPQKIQVGAPDMDGPGRDLHSPKCAACVIPPFGDLASPPALEPTAPPTFRPEARPVASKAGPCLPVRAPPRPPSTAPPAA
jgi:hypothetical protein